MVTNVAAALLMAVVAIAQDNGPKINTPAAVVQCQPTQLQWSGGKPPYWVTVIPAGETTATPLKNLVSQSDSTSYTWNVDLEPNTRVSLSIRDGDGAVQYSSPITIQAGSSTECMNGGGGAAGSSAPASDSAAPTGSQTGGAASSTQAGSSASGSQTGSSASPSTTGASSSTGAAGASSSSTSKSSSGSAGASSSGASASKSGPSGSTSSAPSGGSGSGAMANSVPVIGAAAVAAAVMAAV